MAEKTADFDWRHKETYAAWSKTLPVEHIEASSSFDARKIFSHRHYVAFHECMARVVTDPPTP